MRTRLNRQAVRRNRSRGIASIAVIVLLLIIASLLAVNTAALNQLKREIDLVERKQVEKFQRSEPAPPPEDR
jgi:hypothetical protein